VASVTAILQETGLAAQDLELEITETVAMTDVETSIRRLLALRSLGVRISMDDFGTGYFCLSYLKQIPLNGLKIDRAFVQDLPPMLPTKPWCRRSPPSPRGWASAWWPRGWKL